MKKKWTTLLVNVLFFFLTILAYIISFFWSVFFFFYFFFWNNMAMAIYIQHSGSFYVWYPGVMDEIVPVVVVVVVVFHFSKPLASNKKKYISMYKCSLMNWLCVCVYVIFSCVYFSFHFHSEFDSSKKKKYIKDFFILAWKIRIVFFFNSICHHHHHHHHRRRHHHRHHQHHHQLWWSIQSNFWLQNI